MVKERYGIDIDLYNIHVDDEKTLQFFKNNERYMGIDKTESVEDLQ